MRSNTLLTAKAQFDRANPRPQRVAIQKWMANHQVCKRCNAQLSRRHAVEWSGALQLLQTHFSDLLAQRTNMEELTYILNYHRNTIAVDQAKIRIVYQAIAGIYSTCLGFLQGGNGSDSAVRTNPNHMSPRDARTRNTNFILNLYRTEKDADWQERTYKPLHF